MDTTSTPYRNSRRYYRRNHELRQRQNRSLHRKYNYNGAGTALFVFAVAIIVCGVGLYFTSLGLSAFGGFIGRLLA